MPYISPPRREAYALLRNAVRQTRIDNVGELTYLLDFLADLYMETHNFDYLHLCQVVGAFECAKAEFQRKMVADYEDGKEQANGTVWKQWGPK